MSIMSQQPRRSWKRTYVLWDFVDFPIEGDNIDSFYDNVKTSLYNQGYYGDISIRAFGHRERSTQPEWEALHSSIFMTLLRSRFDRHNNIVLDLVKGASHVETPDKANYMLILKGMAEKEDIEFVSAIKEVKNCDDCDLLLVVGDEEEDKSAYPSDVLSCFTDVWTWSSLKSGGCPISSEDEDEDSDEDEDEDGVEDEDKGEGEDDDNDNVKGRSPKRQCI